MKKTKQIIIKTLKFIGENKITWFFIKYFALIGYSITESKLRKEKLILDNIEKNNFNNKLKDIFKNKIVLNGPFKGLKYSFMESAGSAFYPKLIGSYEKELHDIVYEIFNKPYKQIINIGCGEGYYAIGFLLKMPESFVFAYDIDEKARNLCLNNSIINNVTDRIKIDKGFQPKDFDLYDFNKKTLILCDCEGYEKILFTENSKQKLKNCDLLIELHDFIDIDISSYITNLFFDSHNISIIKSIDDIEKAKTYVYPELINFSLTDKKKIYLEGRPSIMEWAYCTSK